jgi:hypothetical protein
MLHLDRHAVDVGSVLKRQSIFTSTGTGECSEENNYLPTTVVKKLSRKTAENCRLAGVGAPANLSEN